MKITQLVGYINIKYIAICLFFIFYFIVSYGAGVGAHYRYAPHLLLMSVLCIFVYRNKKNGINKSKILSVLFVFATIVVLYSVNYLFFKHPLLSYVQYLSYSLLPFFTCFSIYKFASNGKKEYEFIILIFVIFFIVAIFRFFHEFEAMEYYDAEYKQNNMFYPVLMSLPILLLIQKRFFRFVLLAITILICVLSMKRSAQLIVLFITIIYLYKEVILNRKLRIYTITLITCTLFFLFKFVDLSTVYESFNTTIERFEQISEDGASGRFDMVEKFFKNDINDVHFVLGKGFMGYHDKYPNVIAAHNDLIETYYSYGIFGIFAFIAFLYRLIINTLFAVRFNLMNSLSYISALILFVLFTFSSGCFSFVNLSLAFFSFIALSQAKVIQENEG